jgi:hypothetical protein
MMDTGGRGCMQWSGALSSSRGERQAAGTEQHHCCQWLFVGIQEVCQLLWIAPDDLWVVVG